MRISSLLPLAAGYLVASMACSAPQPTAQPNAETPGAAPAYTPTATIKEIMDLLVDPAGDLVWDATSTVIDAKGTHETTPRSDADWKSVRRGAMTLIESSNLLQIPGRHMARPGEKSEVPGVELEPAEMEALVNETREAWNNYAKNLHAAGVEVLQAAEARDAAKLLDLGGKLDTQCENCHRAYWYPNEKIPDFPAAVTPKGAGE